MELLLGVTRWYLDIRNHATAKKDYINSQASRTLFEGLQQNDVYNKLAVIANDIYKT
jgi:hypothetical protein